MSTIDIKNAQGEVVETAELEPSIFAIEPNVYAMHEVVRAQLAAARQGTSNTKTRGFVSGGGKKPYRQKGTGRARQGSTRAPQWRGGGVVFGPHPRSYAFRVNNKVVKLAMRSALSDKLAEGNLHVVKGFDFDKPSTKAAIASLKALGLEGKKLTLILADDDIDSFLSFRNLPQVRILAACEANTYDLVDNAAVLLTEPALKYIEEVLA
ncbi:MAG: 50S ribosomal protein L4 [Coriobacteriales bacterium]|nr:50S ribosomal protein L4 [Coriobacteriales bacterium]MBQ6586701.1 50S ribosomal protein L4 [Coriobacteriales bacterium]